MPREITKNYKDLQAKAKIAGISLSKLCEQAGVARSTVERMKYKTPHSIESFNRLHEILDSKKA